MGAGASTETYPETTVPGHVTLPVAFALADEGAWEGLEKEGGAGEERVTAVGRPMTVS